MSTDKEKGNPIQVADRLFGTLEYLAEHGRCGLMQLSQAMGLNKSTMHRILCSLQYLGYVQQNEPDNTYELTFRIVGLANRKMAGADLITAIRPYLRRLMEISGETVHFVKREGGEAVYVDKVESISQSVQLISRIGNRIPLYRSGVGKAMAATLPESEVRAIWQESRIEKMTPCTITDYDRYLEALKLVREKGYALDNEENETGVRCIAASLMLNGQAADYAFSISAPAGRMDDARIRELAVHVLAIKAEIEQDIGGMIRV